MSGLWGETVRYADLVSSIFGLVASVTLGVPALQAVRSKRHWEAAERLASGNHAPASQAALESVRTRLEKEQFGGSHALRMCNLVGFILLVLSFAFLMIASVDRALSRTPCPSPAPASPAAACSQAHD